MRLFLFRASEYVFFWSGRIIYHMLQYLFSVKNRNLTSGYLWSPRAEKEK